MLPSTISEKREMISASFRQNTRIIATMKKGLWPGKFKTYVKSLGSGYHILLNHNNFLRGGGEKAQHSRHRCWVSSERRKDSFI